MLSHCPGQAQAHLTRARALVCGALQSRDRDLLQGSPTKLAWPQHSTYNFMMHSQELRKAFFCLKKESQGSQRAALVAGTDIAVCLFNRWPGSHTANQVTHSEGISQMISYHALNFSPQKVSDFSSLKTGLKKHADQICQNSKGYNKNLNTLSMLCHSFSHHIWLYLEES